MKLGSRSKRGVLKKENVKEIIFLRVCGFDQSKIIDGSCREVGWYHDIKFNETL